MRERAVLAQAPDGRGVAVGMGRGKGEREWEWEMGEWEDAWCDGRRGIGQGVGKLVPAELALRLQGIGREERRG